MDNNNHHSGGSGGSGGRNCPRYTAYASGGGGSNNGGSNGGGANGARRKQRAGRHSNNGNNGYRNYGGGDVAPRFSPPRNPQKFKSYSDKRPRTRNAGGGEALDTEIAPGTREAFGYSLDLTDSHEAFGAHRGRDGKKNNYNVNHLLNFRYEEPRRGRNQDGGRPMGRGRKTSNSSAGHVAFNKDDYLLATCQFLLHANVDQKPYLDNPDLLVDWCSVEQVRVRSVGNELCCPICLEEPVAPQVTKCGHVFCYACLLHNAACAEKKWSSCPICFEMVYVEDLRSATLLPTPVVSVGDVLSMTLMTIEVEGQSALPHPAEPANESDDPIAASSIFTKFLSFNDEEILSCVLEPEINAIVDAKKSADTMEIMFLDQALDAVKIRKEKLQQGQWERNETGDFLQAVEGDVDGVIDVPLGSDGACDIGADWFDFEEEAGTEVERESQREEAEEVTTEVEDEEGARGASAEDVESSEMSTDAVVAENLAPPTPAAKFSTHSLPTTGDYFFYQSADGQKIFLHSLNAKCLAFEYGALNAAPTTISARILQIDEGVVTESLRKRCRYLSTLPIRCPFKVIELDLKSPLVSDEAVENFAAELNYRKQQRQSKERYEKRFHRKLQKKEKRQNSTTIIVPSAASTQQAERRPGPELVAEENNNVEQQRATMFPEFNVTVVKHGVTPQHDDDATPNVEEDQVASFAQMLRSGKVGGKPQGTPKAWPDLCHTLGSGAKNSLGDEKPSPWGKKTVVTAAGKETTGKEAGKEAEKGKEGVDEDGEECFVPAFKESFSDALAKAFDNLDVKDVSTVCAKAEEETGVGSDLDAGGKKKKKKPKLLFSTSMQSRMK